MSSGFPFGKLGLPGTGRRAVLLAALGVAAALTEGVGLVLLVPMLGALTGSAESTGGGRIAATLDQLGAPVALEPLLALFVVLVALRAAILLARNAASLDLEIHVVDGLRRRSWRALLQADWRALSAMRQSDNASLLISNLERVGVGIGQLLQALTTAATLAALGLAALALSPGVALGAGLGGLVVLLAFRGLRRRAAALGDTMSAAWNRIHAGLGESLGALRMIKSLGVERQAESGALGGFESLAEARRRYTLSSGLGQLALQASGALLLALLVWVAVRRWQLDAATLLPLVALFARALPLLGGMQEAWQNWLNARPALHETLDLIAMAEAAREPDPGSATAPELTRAITLDAVGVRFAGQDRPALEAVSLVLPAGQITALEGPSGAGKSTLADLLGGLLAPDAGTVAVDDTVLDAPRRRAWRARVAYVQQDPVLLADTVRANLVWGLPGAADDALRQALADAAASFALDLPQGLDTPLGDGGRRLSGGERQRLMLARALLRQPDLLILDEATSALDRANEDAIAAALERLRGRMTILLIAHRGRLLEAADRIVRLDAGRLVSPGRA